MVVLVVDEKIPESLRLAKASLVIWLGEGNPSISVTKMKKEV